MKKKLVTITVEVETNVTNNTLENELIRGIYRGLDTEPNYVAPPKCVKIIEIKVAE